MIFGKERCEKKEEFVGTIRFVGPRKFLLLFTHTIFAVFLRRLFALTPDKGDYKVSNFYLRLAQRAKGLRVSDYLENLCGLGRDRTGDLTIFSRSLVPTELPSQTRF